MIDDKELEFLRRAADVKNLVGRTLMISGMGILIKDVILYDNFQDTILL